MLPTMADLLDLLDLEPVLKHYGVPDSAGNFEAIYSGLHERAPDAPVLRELESAVRDYFTQLKLPPKPTLYDHLVLSLRPKDVIATFNWDPFLFDAWRRNELRAPLPTIVHLHGNVRVGYCLKHKAMAENGRICPDCGELLTPSPLLYPVTEKEYSRDALIKDQWDLLSRAIDQAFTLTIFGYGAPVTDVEAVGMMQRAWNGRYKREIETVEIVDIEEEDVLEERWGVFTFSQHYCLFKDFYDSTIPRHARRSSEAIAAPTLHGQFVGACPIPERADWEGLEEWLRPLLNAERQLGQCQ